MLLDAPLHKSNESAILSVIIPAQGVYCFTLYMVLYMYVCDAFIGSYWNSNSDGHLALLQIDCEIVGTKRVLVDMSDGSTGP